MRREMRGKIRQPGGKWKRAPGFQVNWVQSEAERNHKTIFFFLFWSFVSIGLEKLDGNRKKLLKLPQMQSCSEWPWPCQITFKKVKLQHNKMSLFLNSHRMLFFRTLLQLSMLSCSGWPWPWHFWSNFTISHQAQQKTQQLWQIFPKMLHC